jgi:hypothetical protein
MQVDLKISGSIRKLSLTPKDALVISVDRPITFEVSERLKSHLQKVFPDNKVIVLGPELELSVAGEQIEDQ